MTDTSPSRSEALPWPQEWPQPRQVKALLAVLFFGFFGCVGLAAGASIFLPGANDRRAYLLVLAVPLLFGLAGIAALTRLRLRSRSTSDVRSGQDDATGEPALVIPTRGPWGSRI